jgi:hypothetical protein
VGEDESMPEMLRDRNVKIIKRTQHDDFQQFIDQDRYEREEDEIEEDIDDDDELERDEEAEGQDLDTLFGLPKAKKE